MDRVIGEAEEQAVSYSMQEAVPVRFQWLNAAASCFLTVLLPCCLAEVEGTQSIYFRPILRLVSHIPAAIIWQRL